MRGWSRVTRHSHHPVPGGGERGPQDGTDPTGADDADREQTGRWGAGDGGIPRCGRPKLGGRTRAQRCAHDDDPVLEKGYRSIASMRPRHRAETGCVKTFTAEARVFALTGRAQ